MKPLILLLLIVGALVGVAIVASVATQPAPQTVQCGLGDVGCNVQQSILGLLTAEVIAALFALLAALFILPKAGLKGVAIALLILVVLFLWFVGFPGAMPPLRDFL